MENLSIRQKATRSITLTDEHVRTYAEMTGDHNPLHALVAMDMPGPGTVFLNQNWKFTAPVFIGDTITAEAEILSIHNTKPVTELKVTISRQGGETVLEGEAWCYTFQPEASND